MSTETPGPDGTDSRHAEVTRLLRAVNGGDVHASEELLRTVYDELKRLARSNIRRTPVGETLQPTALVHEAYLRLADHDRMAWKDKTHFYAMAARTMRRVLVEHARSRGRLKRGGDVERRPLEQEVDVVPLLLSPARGAPAPAVRG